MRIKIADEFPGDLGYPPLKLLKERVPRRKRLFASKAKRRVGRAELLASRKEGWRTWLPRSLASKRLAPMAPRHEVVWDWVDALESGKPSRAIIAPWPRGGGKSSTIEMAVARLAIKLTRRFVLIVCATQEQADEHVNHIAAMLEELGIERQVNKYGHSRGWKRDECRTEHGFVVAGFGLNSSARGIKKDEFRPDLIILDDVDDAEDSPNTVAKKIRQITLRLLPAGSTDCAVAFVQNLIHENSVMSQIVEGTAEFLLDRYVAPVEPAIVGLQVQRYQREDGLWQYRIVSGTPTWAGQGIAECEYQINRFGLAAFLRESQQEVRDAGGYVFDPDMIEVEDALPAYLTGWTWCLAWDLAATEGGGDNTAGVLMGKDPRGIYWVADVHCGKWSSEKVENTIIEESVAVFKRFGSKCIIRLPQDPAQAGKSQARRLKRKLVRAGIPEKCIRIKPVTGRKAVRASGYAAAVNIGNVSMVDAPWNAPYTRELRRFREDEEHEADDQVDASADAFNELDKGPHVMTARTGRR